jgi:hypothetical protein
MVVTKLYPELNFAPSIKQNASYEVGEANGKI